MHGYGIAKRLKQVSGRMTKGGSANTEPYFGQTANPPPEYVGAGRQHLSWNFNRAAELNYDSLIPCLGHSPRNHPAKKPEAHPRPILFFCYVFEWSLAWHFARYQTGRADLVASVRRSCVRRSDCIGISSCGTLPIVMAIESSQWRRRGDRNVTVRRNSSPVFDRWTLAVSYARRTGLAD
jgi:hypothetical protein